MDSLEIAVSVIVNAFRWIFKSLGGKRSAAILSLLCFPFVLVSILVEPSIGSFEAGLVLIITGLLTSFSIYAIWQTQFFATPLSACNTITNTSAWISIIGGYLILIVIFGVFILTVMIMFAVMAAVLDSFGINSRR